MTNPNLMCLSVFILVLVLVRRLDWFVGLIDGLLVERSHLHLEMLHTTPHQTNPMARMV